MEFIIKPYNTLITHRINPTFTSSSSSEEHQSDDVLFDWIPCVKEHFLHPLKNTLDCYSTIIKQSKVKSFDKYKVSLILLYENNEKSIIEQLVSELKKFFCLYNIANTNTQNTNFNNLLDIRGKATEEFVKFQTNIKYDSVLITNSYSDPISLYFPLTLFISGLEDLDIKKLEKAIKDSNSNKNKFDKNKENSNTNTNNDTSITSISSTTISAKLYTFEILSQTIFLIKHLIKEYVHDNKNININRIDEIASDYFSNSVKVIYLLEQNPVKKNYRKREITMPSKCIFYISLVNLIKYTIGNEVSNSNIFYISLSKYLSSHNISGFLQRNPEFYFNHKNLALQLTEILISHGVRIINDFSVFDFLYIRSNMLLTLNNFLPQFNSNLEVKKFSSEFGKENSTLLREMRLPETIIYNKKNKNNINNPNTLTNKTTKYNTDDILYLSNSKSKNFSVKNFLKNGIITKNDHSGNHEMRLYYIKDSEIDTINVDLSTQRSSKSVDSLQNEIKRNKNQNKLDSMKVLRDLIINKEIDNEKNKVNHDTTNDTDDTSQTTILQRLIPHNEVLIKVYYLNNEIKVVLRKSLDPNNCFNKKNCQKFNAEIEDKESTKCVKFKTEDLYNSSKNEEVSEKEKEVIGKLNHYFKLFCDDIKNKFNINLFNADFLMKIVSDESDENSNISKKISKDNLSNCTVQIYLLELNYFPSYKEYYEKRKENFDNHIISICQL